MEDNRSSIGSSISVRERAAAINTALTEEQKNRSHQRKAGSTAARVPWRSVGTLGGTSRLNNNSLHSNTERNTTYRTLQTHRIPASQNREQRHGSGAIRVDTKTHRAEYFPYQKPTLASANHVNTIDRWTNHSGKSARFSMARNNDTAFQTSRQSPSSSSLATKPFDFASGSDGYRIRRTRDSDDQDTLSSRASSVQSRYENHPTLENRRKRKLDLEDDDKDAIKSHDNKRPRSNVRNSHASQINTTSTHLSRSEQDSILRNSTEVSRNSDIACLYARCLQYQYILIGNQKAIKAQKQTSESELWQGYQAVEKIQKQTEKSKRRNSVMPSIHGSKAVQESQKKLFEEIDAQLEAFGAIYDKFEIVLAQEKSKDSPEIAEYVQDLKGIMCDIIRCVETMQGPEYESSDTMLGCVKALIECKQIMAQLIPVEVEHRSLSALLSRNPSC
ncbi:hypothetical protein CLU79DRAFT_727813 [Phycomyces nitens]|nr:hypothetical protein CLU79DRAFT_727813 [Phycomyces nitens]